MTSSRAWVTDRPPTRDDADKESRVELAKYPEGDSCVQVNWKQVGVGARWRPTKHWQDPAIACQLMKVSFGISCETCRFFMKWSKPGGECRRNAPQAVMVHADIDDSEHIAYCPGVDPPDWCGEWEAKQ